MDKAFISINPVNMMTVFLLSGFAYLGVYGAKMVIDYVKQQKGSAA